MNSTEMSPNASGNLTSTDVILPPPYSYLSQQMTWGIGVSVFFLGLVGFAENVFVTFLLVFGHGFLDAPANIFLLSLVIADTLLCLSIMPLVTASFFYGWAYVYMLHAGRLFGAGTVGSIFLLSVNKVISVLNSLTYPQLMTIRRAVFLVAIVWGTGLIFFLLSVVGGVTGVLWLEELTRYIVSISLFLTISSNMFLYKKSRDHKRAITAQLQAVHAGRMSREDFRATKTTLLVSGTFALGWIPVLLAVMCTNRLTDPETHYNALYSAIPFMTSNALVDPIIYFFQFDQFRQFYQRQKRRFFPDLDIGSLRTPATPSGFVIPNRVSPI